MNLSYEEGIILWTRPSGINQGRVTIHDRSKTGTKCFQMTMIQMLSKHSQCHAIPHIIQKGISPPTVTKMHVRNAKFAHSHQITNATWDCRKGSQASVGDGGFSNVQCALFVVAMFYTTILVVSILTFVVLARTAHLIRLVRRSASCQEQRPPKDTENGKNLCG